MRNLNLDQLQTLVAIADLGTLAAAAQALHLAPPTISLHLKELESRFETQLLVRGRKKVELTAAGAMLVQEGRKLLSASDALADQVRRYSLGLTGLVSIGLSAGVDTQLLPRVLDRLASQCPEIEIRLEVLSSATALQRISAGTLELGIIALERYGADTDVRIDVWREDTVVAVLPGDWEIPDVITPQWLSQQRWASFAPESQLHRLISKWFGLAGYHSRPYLSISYPGALKSLALAKQSAVLLPSQEVEDLRASTEVTIRQLAPSLMRPMALAYRHTAAPQSPVASVLKVLKQFSQH